MRRSLLCTVVLLVLISQLASAPTAGSASAPPAGFMGMVVRDPHYEWRTNPAYPGVNEAFLDEMGRNLEAAGVEWVRIEFRAEDEYSDVRGRVRLEQYDYFINIVAPRHGLKVLALLATQLGRWPDGEQAGKYIEPNDWDRVPGDDHPVYGGGVNTYTRIFLDNAFAIAERFPYVTDPDTGRKKGIAAFEILNEQNRYIGGGGKGLDPRFVANLVTKFYRIYKEDGGPNRSIGPWRNEVPIILGGIHPGRCDDCLMPDGSRMTDRQYLDAIYKSTAFASYKARVGHSPIDGVGYHPYPNEVEPGLLQDEYSTLSLVARIPQRMSDMRAVMEQNGDPANKIWVTEIGDRGAPQDLENQQRQAGFLRSVYWMLWQQRAFVQAVFWFKYEDFAVPQDPTRTGPENWGVVRIVPRMLPECPDCEAGYAYSGEVQVYKQSFYAYQGISRYGTGLETTRVYLPIAMSVRP